MLRWARCPFFLLALSPGAIPPIPGWKAPALAAKQMPHLAISLVLFLSMDSIVGATQADRHSAPTPRHVGNDCVCNTPDTSLSLIRILDIGCWENVATNKVASLRCFDLHKSLGARERGSPGLALAFFLVPGDWIVKNNPSELTALSLPFAPAGACAPETCCRRGTGPAGSTATGWRPGPWSRLRGDRWMGWRSRE